MLLLQLNKIFLGNRADAPSCPITEEICGRVKMNTILSDIQETQNGSYFFETLKSLDLQCRMCSPITPLRLFNKVQSVQVKK
jgi:hypothetical protein